MSHDTFNYMFHMSRGMGIVEVPADVIFAIIRLESIDVIIAVLTLSNESNDPSI